jgi:7-keto-8-aminopelargonate synthetase-like enzyme
MIFLRLENEWPSFLLKKKIPQESSTSALEKYGVGSCGPRGFYGTIGETQFQL